MTGIGTSAGPQPGCARRVRLLIADVDGTLVTQEKVLTARARQAVRRLREVGIAFAITSGRPPRGMSMLIDALGIDTPTAAFNGGMFVRPDLSIIDQRVLPAEVVGRVIRILEAHGLDVWVYRGPDWFVRQRHGPHVDREEWTVKFPPTVVSSFKGLQSQVVKIVGVSDDLRAVARCEADIRRECEEQVSASRSQLYYLDVTHPDANKGAVVRRLSDFLAIPTAEIATIGDMPNDILMFTKSGLSIAMGSAGAEVRQAAQHVTTSSEEEGFANAVEHYILC
jgi:Cof subfamily protein (haloacid dehalogenase superfamily)